MKGRRVAKVNKLILDGVEYCLSDSLVAKLKEEMSINDAMRSDRTVFGRFGGGQYFFTDKFGGVRAYIDGDDKTDDALYAVANYCRDEEMMEQRALHETLNRLLWRYSETHGGDNSWETTDNHHHFICRCVKSGFAVMYSIDTKAHGVVYFKDDHTAWAAIEDVVYPFLAEHPEFKW
jgi:hypothetical protein